MVSDSSRLALVVDDEPALRRALVRSIASAFTAIEAATPEQAIAAIDRHPDLAVIITDYDLAHGRSGSEVLSHARQTMPSIPRIVVSGALGDGVLRAALIDSKLADLCIRKPWKPDQLLEIVAAVVAERTPGILAQGSERIDADTKRQVEDIVAYSRQRGNPRYPATWNLDIRFTSWTQLRQACTINVSRGGLMCRMTTPPRVGEKIDLVAHLPDGEQLQLPSRVRHVATIDDQASSSYRVGVEFDTVDEVRAKLLAIANLAARE